MIKINIIDREHRSDVNIPNRSFPLIGRMVPSLKNGEWDYKVEKFAVPSVMCFPDENYDYDQMIENSVFIGAYDKEVCVGLAVLQEGMFRYAYLYDLKVNPELRGKGIAKLLIDRAGEIARSKGYGGIYTQAQDNNLSACLFYLKSGFRIGGFDNTIYKGTAQEGKSDIVFYLDF